MIDRVDVTLPGKGRSPAPGLSAGNARAPDALRFSGYEGYAGCRFA